MRLKTSVFRGLLLGGLTLAAATPLLAAGLPPVSDNQPVVAAVEEARLHNIDQVMLHLNAGEKNTAMLPDVYTDDVVFIDPIFPEGLHGQEALVRYHTNLNAMIESFEVTVQEVMRQENLYLVFWHANATLNVAAGLKVGPVSYDGMTRFGFTPGATKISYHRDYYDSLTQYESIPLLKQILGAVKDQTRKSLTKPIGQN